MTNLNPIPRSPRDIAQTEHLLLCDLKRLLGSTLTLETRPYLANVLDCLFELLPSCFAMKERGGYLTEVTRKFPSWTDQVEALRMEHDSLYEDLRELRRSLDHEMSYQAAAPRILQRIAGWSERLE